MKHVKSFIVAGALAVSTNGAAATEWLSENAEAFQSIYIATPASEHAIPDFGRAEYEWGILVEDLLGRNFDTACKFNGFDGYEVRCVKADPYRAVLDKDNNLTLFKAVDNDMIKLNYRVESRYQTRHLVDFNDVRAAFKLPPYPPVQKSGS
jgi:hypothetical protein